MNENTDSIDLSRYIIDKLPDDFIKFQNLKFLNLGHTRLKENVKLLKKLSKLQSIYIEIDSFNEIPKILIPKIKGITYEGKSYNDLKLICGLKQLNYLAFNNYSRWVFYFKFNRLPESFFNLTNLKEANFERIKIDSIVGNFSKLKSLQKLTLRLDSNTYLSPQITQLSNLQYLSLDLIFRDIPDYIYSLKNLDSLFLFGGYFDSVSNKLAQLKNLKYLDLSSNALKRIPPVLFKMPQIEYLSFHSGKINGDSIPSDIKNLTQLKTLILSNDNLLSLPSEIGQLKNLQKLDVSENRLSSLPESISNLTNLIDLDCSINQIKHLPADLKKLQDLNSLSAYSNKLQDLPIGLKELKSLNLLSIGSNPNINLDNLSGIQNLQGLSIYKTNINKIPYWVYANKNLNWLDISDNNIEELNDSLTILKNLKYLYASNCNIVQINIDFDKLPNLEVVNLFYNSINFSSLYNSLSRVKKPVHIKQIDDNIPTALTVLYRSDAESLIDDMTKVKTLEYFDCGVDGSTHNIPAEIGKNTELKYLGIANRKLEKIPESLTGLKDLEILNLGMNNLKKLPDGFSHLTSLKELLLYSNNFSEIPKQLNNLPYLKNLNLSQNSIVNIQNLSHLRNLMQLSLDNNQITNLPASIKNLKNLTYLNLRNNNISILPKEIFQMKNLRSLDLSWNPITESYYKFIKNKMPNCNVEWLPKGTIRMD